MRVIGFWASALSAAVVGLAVTLAIGSLPDIKRYLRIRSM